MKTNLERFDNSWYWKNYNDSFIIKRVVWYIVSASFINSYWPCPIFIKRIILKIFGAKIGKGVVIKPKVNIKYPWFLEIDDFTWIGENVWIDNLFHVKIGKNACISQGALILTGNHDFTKSTFDLKKGEITIEDGVWIGAMSIVAPGLTCGSHSVLSLGSIATKNLEPYGIYKGNPAELIKQRDITS